MPGFLTDREAMKTMTDEIPDLSMRLDTAAAVTALVHRIEAADRHEPIVIVSPSNGVAPFAIPPSRIAAELAGRAHVYVLSTVALAWQLHSHPTLRTYGGAVRVIGPLSWSRVIRTDTADALRRVLEAVAEAQRRMDSARAPITLDTPTRSAPTLVTPNHLARKPLHRPARLPR